MCNYFANTVITSIRHDRITYFYANQPVTMSKKNEQYNRLGIVLAEKNISAKDLAKGIKKDPATVSRWRTNETQPAVKVLYQIANFLDIDVRDLLVPNKTSATGKSR